MCFEFQHGLADISMYLITAREVNSEIYFPKG